MAFQKNRGSKPFRPKRRGFGGKHSSQRTSQDRGSSRNKAVKSWPEVGEIVVVKVDKVLNYGVFASLVEHEGAVGFIHISQVESSWIKNIRNYVREGQTRAALVQKVDKEKLQIDLSLTKVSERQQRLRINEYKQLKRNQKLVEVMAKTKGKTLEQGWREIAEPLMNVYGSLPDAFEAIALEGEEAVEDVNKEWVPVLVEVVQKNVKPPEKAIRGTLTVISTASNGVEIVKKALLDAQKVKDSKVEYAYLGSGKYRVKVVSFDYKVAENSLAELQEKIKKNLAKQGTFEFTRQEA
jgi:translation initiation factor 2 subunit 1